MSENRFDEVQSLFRRVWDVPKEEREPRLRAETEDDDLVQEVLELLDWNDRCGAFLEPPIDHQPRNRRGDLIDKRYQLENELGSGGSGKTWRAIDTYTGNPVAVKLLDAPTFRRRAVLGAELAALRMLRLPQVIHLLDDGTTEQGGFIVTEIVDGAPFPGPVFPLSWDRVLPRLLGLLEALDRLHHAGFIHRDLKPENVFVSDDGIVTLLDLGLARDLSVPLAPWEEGAGTRAYAAPEQIEGERLTPSSDLYSVGVMVHEALTGQLPREIDGDEILLPTEARALLDRLLAEDPLHRPATASEALACLDAGHRSVGVLGELPVLATGTFQGELTEALHRGESLDLWGPPGSGRTSCLESIAAGLESAGHVVHWSREGQQAFTSIEAWLDEATLSSIAPSGGFADNLLSRLLSDLPTTSVFLVDDTENIDESSAQLLEHLRRERPVLRTYAAPRAEARALPRMLRSQLEPLFRGPECLHYLRSDPARLLLDATQGWPGRVVGELSSWLRTGLASWENEALVLSRASLQRLQAQPRRPVYPRRPAHGLSDLARRLLHVLADVGDEADTTLLSRSCDSPTWTVDAELESLVERGYLCRSGDGRHLVLALPTDSHDPESDACLSTAHGLLADELPPGDPRRLRHVLAARRLHLLPEEMEARAERAERDGDESTAFTIVLEALNLRRRRGDDVLSLLTRALKLAVRLGTATELERVLRELELTASSEPMARELETLARAAYGGLQRDGLRALEQLERSQPLDDIELELMRHSVRFTIAQRSAPDRLPEMLDELAESTLVKNVEGRRLLLSQRAWLHYHAYRFEEAAALHVQAADIASVPSECTASLLSAANAQLDGGHHEDALCLVDDALERLGSCRHLLLESWAAWLKRSARYRMAHRDRPDLELIEAARLTGLHDYEGNILLFEAAFAWRAQRLELARQLASEVARLWRRTQRPHLIPLAEALRVAAGGDIGDDELKTLRAQAAELFHPGLALQALGLLCLGEKKVDVSEQLALELANTFPRSIWSRRREIMSVEEALRACDVRPPPLAENALEAS
ncbi:MAG: serine/threonine-protein kinase [Acidobacteriota bacterium]